MEHFGIINKPSSLDSRHRLFAAGKTKGFEVLVPLFGAYQDPRPQRAQPQLISKDENYVRQSVASLWARGSSRSTQTSGYL